MILSKYFFPDLKYRCVGDIDVEKLSKKGIKYAILDIDNTLVPYTTEKPDQNALAFLHRLEENNIKYCFLSNNSIERIDIFNEEIKAPGFPDAKKPLLSGINRAVEFFNAEKSECVMIGDQIFTDVTVGKRAEILTVLVDPIKEVETSFFKFKRYFERKILKVYYKKRK